MTQIHQLVEFSTGLHLSVQNVYGYHLYGIQCILEERFCLETYVSEMYLFWSRYESRSKLLLTYDVPMSTVLIVNGFELTRRRELTALTYSVYGRS